MEISPEKIVRCVSSKVEDGKLISRVEFNKHHPNFKEYWNQTVDGWVGSSIEFARLPNGYTINEDGKRIHHKVDYKGFTLTKRPQNRFSRALRAWTAG
jgi:L-ascorbate metabolism protein UlaG (beta-lactamase superfamily)